MKIGMTISERIFRDRQAAFKKYNNPIKRFAFIPTRMDDTCRWVWLESYWEYFYIPKSWKANVNEWECYKGYWQKREWLP